MVAFAALVCIDVLVRFAFPPLLRFETNFSAAYLRSAIAPTQVDGHVVFLGDSVLWGYKIAPREAAVSRLIAAGVPARNLSFEGGSIVNTYALLRSIEAFGGRPSLVVFNVNLKEFNRADSAYATLYPALEKTAWPLLANDERSRLKATQQRATIDAFADDRLSRVWALYGMRSDIRNLLFGDSDAATAFRSFVNRASGEEQRAEAAHRPTPDRFLGTYDLSPLTQANVEVFFLRRIGQLMRSEHVPAIAVLTPTNHVLLHDYIDTPEYDAQLRYAASLLEAYGIRVVNYDRAFGSSDFLDNDHLTARAQATFAERLRKDIRL